MLLRIDHRFLYILAILCGILASWSLSRFFQFSFPSWRYQGFAVSLPGKVVSMDPAKREISLFVDSVFPTGTGATMRVMYDDSTVWASNHYIFDRDYVVIQEKRIESVRSFPNGALLRILIRPDETGPLKASGITYLRRTTL